MPEGARSIEQDDTAAGYTPYDSGELPEPETRRQEEYESSLAREIQLENLSMGRGFDAQSPESGDLEGSATIASKASPAAHTQHPHDATWSNYWKGLPHKLRGGVDTRLPIPDVHELFWTFVGAFVSIFAISALSHFAGEKEDIVYLVGSFGASAVLLFAVTESKLAQPRNFVGGQILGALVGLGIRHAIHKPWVAAPLAMALALTVMQLTSTTHPPGGATALIIGSVDVIPKWAGFSYLVGVAGGCAVMLATALIVNNLAPRRRYPTYWW